MNLWHLGWPQVAEGFLSVIDQIADLIWAGRLGFQAIAGLGVAQSYVMLLMTTRMGFDSSMRAMISRAIGGRNIPYANHVLLQSLNLATLFSLLVSTLGILLTDTLLRVLGVSDAVASQAAGYMRLQFIAMAVMSYQRLSAGALQASGDSFTPLKAATVTRVSHLVLSPVLIFGWGWFPAMGLAGAACANLVAQCLGVGMNFVALFAGSSRLQLTLKGYTFDAPLIWRLLKVGAPAAVTGAQRAVTNLVFLSIVAPFGDGALAAFSLTRRTENVVMQSSRGLGRAAGALAGQNLGAGQPDRAKSSVLWAIGYVGIASAVLAAVFILFPHAVASFFNSDVEFVALASRWLFIQAIGVLSFSAVQVLTQAFNTSGETVAPMVVTLTTAWLVELPLAITLSRFTSLGEFGVPWATVVGMTLRMTLLSGHFFRGRWLKTGMI
jgi:putative MATE family efflux protein